jgi:hypothetical protein
MARASLAAEKLKRCHSERSEESLFCLFSYTSIEERFFASLRMTEQDIFFRSLSGLNCANLKSKSARLKTVPLKARHVKD